MCVYVCVYICMCVYIYVYKYIYIYCSHPVKWALYLEGSVVNHRETVCMLVRACDWWSRGEAGLTCPEK